MKTSLTLMAVVYSNAINAAASKRPFQLVLVIVAAFYWWRVLSAISILQSGAIGAFTASSLRLQILEVDGGDVPPTSINMSFGLLLDGCAVPGGRLIQIGDTDTVFLNFSTPVSANGYYIDTFGQSVYPVRWLVEASSNMSDWMAVGASVWRQYDDGTMGLYSHLRYSASSPDRGHVTVDHRIPWEWTVDSVVANIIYGLGWFCQAIVGMAGRENLVRQLLLAMSLSASLLFVVEAVGYHLDGQLYTAVSIWIEFGPSQLIWNIGIAFFGGQVLGVLAIFALSVLCTLIARDTGLYWRPIIVPLSSFLTSSSMLILTFVAMIFCARRWIIHRSVQLVIPDKEKYDASWAELTDNPEVMQEILTLQNMVTELESRIALPARQLNLNYRCQKCGRECGAQHPCSYVQLPRGSCQVSTYSAARLELSSPVRSLDQLFIQARCLGPLLREKSKVYCPAKQGRDNKFSILLDSAR